MKKSAFTLIELLVVMVIIGLLSGLITPVALKARKAARRAVCANNARQIGMGFIMYVEDNDFRFPQAVVAGSPTQYWYDFIGAYLDDDDIWHCPEYKYSNLDKNHMSYGYNFWGLQNRDIDMVETPSKCILLADTITKNNNKSDYRIRRDKAGMYPGDRHSGDAIVFFVDGHVSAHKQSFLTTDTEEGYDWWNYGWRKQQASPVPLP